MPPMSASWSPTPSSTIASWCSPHPKCKTSCENAPPMALGADSDIVGICVRADDDVVDVVTGPDGVLHGMTEGGVIVVHSTTDPETCRRLAAQASDRGASLVDAPVSGGGQRAAEREL